MNHALYFTISAELAVSSARDWLEFLRSRGSYSVMVRMISYAGNVNFEKDPDEDKFSRSRSLSKLMTRKKRFYRSKDKRLF